MPWVLKAREPETGFLGQDEHDQFVIVQESDAAKTFNSLKEAQTFQTGISATHAATAWRSRAPELLLVRIGAKSFIVRFWARVFGFLGSVSLFWLFTRIRCLRENYVFVEIWVLSWGAAALGSLLAVAVASNRALLFILTIIGGLRVAEIVIYHINVLLFDEWRCKQKPSEAPYAVRSYRRSVILLIHNYLEILVWFATFYIRAAIGFHSEPDGLSLDTVVGALYHSVVTMTTLGYGDIYPKTGEWVAAFLTVSQTIIGVFLAVVVLARVIGLVPRPLSMDEHEGA